MLKKRYIYMMWQSQTTYLNLRRLGRECCYRVREHLSSVEGGNQLTQQRSQE